MIKLDTGEIILMEIRKHWLIFILQILPTLFFAILPYFIFEFFSIFSNSLSLDAQGFTRDQAFWATLYTGWLIVMWTFICVAWTNYYLDVWVITNRKIVSVDQVNLFDRQTTIMQLDKIQDVNFKVSGLLATLIDIGDVSIQTAGAEVRFNIQGVGHPILIHKRLNEILTHFRTHSRLRI